MHVCDERAKKRKKYRDCLLVYRRVRGKEAWQLLPEHGEALDRFEEHLEVSLRVFPVSARRELDWRQHEEIHVGLKLSQSR